MKTTTRWTYKNSNLHINLLAKKSRFLVFIGGLLVNLLERNEKSKGKLKMNMLWVQSRRRLKKSEMESVK